MALQQFNCPRPVVMEKQVTGVLLPTSISCRQIGHNVPVPQLSVHQQKDCIMACATTWDTLKPYSSVMMTARICVCSVFALAPIRIEKDSWRQAFASAQGVATLSAALQLPDLTIASGEARPHLHACMRMYPLW